MSHLWQKRSHQNKSRKGNYFRLVVKIKPCIVSGINLSKIFRDDLLPALPSFCRCSATSLIESCSTLEVIMWGRPLLPFWCLSPCSAALQFLQKCSTAVWSTRLLAWKKISLPWTTAACLTLRFSWCSFINPEWKRSLGGNSNDHLCSTWCENDVFCFPSNHSRHILSGLMNHCFGFST